VSISPAPIWAAGGVPLRGTGKDREVLLIHRPAYDDWTLPKGKAKTNEFLTTTAVREVEEETSVAIRLGSTLTPTRYVLGQTMKFTSWWVGVPLTMKKHKGNSEVDQIQWMSPKKATKMLSYADEREVLAEALALPHTTPVIILRHGKAAKRELWKKADKLRPLSAKGRAQLPYLSQILGPFGVTKLHSSSALRCVSTLEPYGQSRGLEIISTEALSENATELEAEAYMARLVAKISQSGEPVVACGHRPLIPAMMGAVDIPVRPLGTASCVIAHVDDQGTTIRSEWHDTLRTKR